MIKPTIVYVEKSDLGSGLRDNYFRDSLIFILRNVCGCNVFVYEDKREFNKNVAAVKKLFSLGDLILIIIAQEEYLDDYLHIISKIREKISDKLPIALIRNFRAQDKIPESLNDSLISVHDHEDVALTNLVEDLKNRFEPHRGWLGADGIVEEAILMKQLESAYHQQFEDDEGGLCAVDHNHQIVAEALRIKLLPPELLVLEFDNSLRKGKVVIRETEASVYNDEVDRIRQMTTEEHQQLEDLMLTIEGCEKSANGGYQRTRASFGDKVLGFAIDSVTMESLVVQGEGLHHGYAQRCLSYRIQKIEEMRNRDNSVVFIDPGQYSQRIVQGFIYLSVGGFKTPFLCLLTRDSSEEEIHAVARHIMGEKKYIPVTTKGYLIE